MKWPRDCKRLLLLAVIIWFANVCMDTREAHRRYQFSLSKRITEWLRLEGASVDHLVQHPAQSTTMCYSGLAPLSISMAGGSMVSLGNSLNHLTTVAVKREGIAFMWNALYFNLCPLASVLSLGTTERILALSSSLPTSGTWWSPQPQAFFPLGWAVPALSLSLCV